METNANSEVGGVSTGSSSHVGSRVVRFGPTPGLVCDVRTGSGNLRISHVDGSSGEVRLSTNDPDSERRLAQVECVYHAATNKLLIDTHPGQVISGAGAGIKKVWSRWIDSVRHDVDIELLLPLGAGVKFRTASGDLVTSAELDEIDVASASGDVTVARVRGSLSFRSASGDLGASEVTGSVESKTASGDVHLGRVGGEVNIQVVSGDVALTIGSPVAARINTVSGDVKIGVTAGLLIEVDANTVSGELASDIALDGGHGGSNEEALRLKVRTVSGDVKIYRN